ncbi:MAG: hypothetical protein HQL71_03675 [Magnetococcales bacterium]|nr:hypothetical protein [Magnetococcales bacterium]
MQNVAEDSEVKGVTKGKRPLKIALIVLILIAVAELSSFLLLSQLNKMGFWPQEPTLHPYLGWRPPANATLRLSSHSAYWDLVEYNNIETDEGSRPITPISYKDPDIHVAITGGGPLMGVGTPNNANSIPSLVEKMIFEKMGIKAEVHNLSVGGYNSFQEMLFLLDFLKENKLDLAISISGLNDYINGFEEPYLRSTALVDSVYDRVRPLNEGLSFLSYIRSKSNFVEVMISVLPKAYVRFHDYISIGNESTFTLMLDDAPLDAAKLNDIDKRVNITSLHYSMINLLTKKFGAEFVVMLMPQTFTKDQLSDAEVKNAGSRVNVNGRVSNENLKVYGQKFYDGFVNIEKDYAFHDITNIFDDTKESMFVDMFTYNGPGAKRVAEEIFKNIEPTLRNMKK